MTDVDWLASQYPLFIHPHLRTWSGVLLWKAIWPFLLTWNYRCCMENKEEEVFCAPCWYCPLIHLQEVNPKKLFMFWFFYFPPRFDYFSHILPAVWTSHPSKNISKSFLKRLCWARQVTSACHFVCTELEQLFKGSLVLPLKVAKCQRMY